MAAGNFQASVASQIEFVRPELEQLMMFSSRLWQRIKSRTDIKAVSGRPSRIPFEALSGGKFRAANPDGGDLGRGSGPIEVNGNLSCVFFTQVSEYTAQAEWTTDGDEKAIKNYVTLTNQRATETMAGYFDATFQGDGSNTLDTVVSTATTNAYVVSNANYFQDGQDLDVWSALGGTFRGTVTIESVDIANNTIWLTGPQATGSTAGDLLLVSGSAGVANSGLAGLRAYQVTGNSGTYMGVSRSAYPGKFSTPGFAANGSLTPALVRALEAQIKLAIGIERADQGDLVAHCNVDMEAAWENNAILVQRVVMNEVKGDQSVDMLKRNAPTQIAGREMLVNERAAPGLIDFLALKHWFRIEAKALDYYEVGGQTVFPVYGASGGIATSCLFSYVCELQIGNGQPRMGAVLSSINIPSKYFNH